ncbi:MAG: ligase-associated DNA damage response DEXH box helicase [Ignavibacteriae bacterium]|nr:MAG: ligase-associated DNA damage response DEXH box helicase [Ignavibacteriota bacterium]
MKTSYNIVLNWFTSNGWTPFEFQKEVWDLYLKGYSGLLNAPTGSGKTYALWLPVIIDWINKHPKDYKKKRHNKLQLLWITPLKALSKDIQKALHRTVTDLEIPWNIAVRTGDTSTAKKLQQKTKIPEVLITTPESLHVLLAQKDYADLFSNLTTVVIDEWHELLGSKRGVQVELGLSRLKALKKDLKIWGVSATIGNLDEAKDVLLGSDANNRKTKIVKAELYKKIEIESVLPDEVEKFPWTGHLGIRLLPKIIPIIDASRTTLIFTNVRSQCEIWFQKLIDYHPELAGVIALHHGSIDRKIRDWVESALHREKLKVVVCTSSLDLGVDFRPVETVIQIGSPKGVARFLQRAGRSGHQPGAVSKIYFVPTHSLELVEAAALKQAIKDKQFENRDPYIKPYDVLIQYLVTLAVSNGFDPVKTFHEVKTTFAYESLTESEWQWIVDFIHSGGKTLTSYDEYNKVVKEDGVFIVNDRKKAIRHKMGIGTIVSDASMSVKLLTGKNLGSVEEGFITRLKTGDIFSFAGRTLELLYLRGMTAYVKKAKAKNAIVPSWLGGRMPLSSQLSQYLRIKIDEAGRGITEDIEIKEIQPIINLQQRWSKVPSQNELLIEKIKTREGYHLFIYPFEGRLVHEGMGALIAYRLAKYMPITFTIAMNDYGFELLSDKDFDAEYALSHGLFSNENLTNDIQASINSIEMAKRKFREIARVSGLIFQGYPGSQKTNRNIQASSELLFDVFSRYEPDNLLLKQAYEEMLYFQLEEARLRQALDRINSQKIILTYPKRPTPFAFPILVDSMREKLSTEKLSARVMKMQLQLEKWAEQ